MTLTEKKIRSHLGFSAFLYESVALPGKTVRINKINNYWSSLTYSHAASVRQKFSLVVKQIVLDSEKSGTESPSLFTKKASSKYLARAAPRVMSAPSTDDLPTAVPCKFSLPYLSRGTLSRTDT